MNCNHKPEKELKERVQEVSGYNDGEKRRHSGDVLISSSVEQATAQCGRY